MNPDCYRRSPLTHHGTTQEGRLLAALLPDCVKIDGRGMVELISFAGRYAGQLAYYNERNEHDGTWTGLLRPNVSFVTADTAKRRWLPLAATFDKYLDGLVDNLGAGAGDRARRFKTLFDVVFSLFLEVEEVHRALPAGSPLAADVRREIAGRLRTELTRLIGFYRGAAGEGPAARVLVNSGHWQTPAPDDGFAFRDARAVVDGTLSPLWIPDSTAAPDWRAWSSGITPDETIFAGSNDEKRTANSIPHVRAVWERAYNAYVRIIGNASDRLESTLTDDAAHQPHVALLLTFFRLFGRAQSDLNALTTKHFDFYLREILDLRTRPPRADSAHVIVELAKHVPERLIAAGTELKGGKDAEGIERIYVVDDDLVANHAQVSALRTLFVDDADPSDPSGGVFDAPVAKSADGLGEVDLDPESPLFRPFGQPQKADLPRPTMRRSTLGWAFASPLLRLAQGTRVVTLEFLCERGGGLATLPPATELGKWFEVAFSGAEKWIVASEVTAETNITDADNPVLHITATLGAETEPVIDFDDAVLDGAYDTAWPVARIRLRAGEDETTNRHAKLAQVVVRKVTVTVKVTGMTDLVLQNDLGPLNPSGAFLPFGPRPKLGSNFYVGSHEAMTKPLTWLALDLEWLGLPGTSFKEHYDDYVMGIAKNTDFKADVMFLTGGEWSVDAGTKPLFDEGLHYVMANYPHIDWSVYNTISQANRQVDPSLFGELTGGGGSDAGTASSLNPGSLLDQPSFGEDAPARFVHLVFELENNFANEPSLPHFDTFDLTVQQGFLRLELAAPLGAFGHDIYPNLYADRVIKISRSIVDPDTGKLYVLPNEPYTPTLRFLSLDYEATASLVIGDTAGRDAGQFFQLHPFGLREARQPTPFLLTPYLHKVSGEPQPYGGALFVGLERAEPGSVVSLLVQVAEGTEDSSAELPGAVVWSYLSSDRWEPLGDAVISDTTRDFLASGIVRIQIPDDADDDNALLAGSAPRDERESQPALRWLRASISNNFAALPQMLDVRAQALRATFDDRDNAANHLETPLPAGQIARLVRPQSAVRKLEQPYESFGGRPQEAPRRFYVRTSERLRHKRRAITIWDYERLVLEEFPELYKVKCVPHARREPDGETTEVIAGSVLVVVIPDFRNRVAGDKFRPKVSNATRDEIREYLAALNCPFAELQVVNPTYEAIQVAGKVAFTRPDTAFYLDQLRADLDKLLAPWVFEQGRTLEFGGTLHRSTVVKFMEDLGYVDFVTDVALNVFDDAGAIATQVPVVEATTARSILTSNTSHEFGTAVCLSS